MTWATLALENAALRQQLAVYLRTSKRARLRASDRVFWIVLRRLWPDWTRSLIIVKLETVIAWHRQGFKVFWRRKSRQGEVGRPRIPRKHIAFIQRISGDQTWRTFVRNHAKEVWACDFLTQYTALFAVTYVFVIMEIGSRRIVHVNFTTNPTLSWVKQQIREATAEV
jgi:putative transposase